MDRRSYGFFEIRRLKLKLNERIKNISKLLVFFRSREILDYKNFQTKAYLRQKNIADFIKKRRTVKLLHILRNYSALAVVISSAILVVATNAAADKKSGGFLFGFQNEEEDQVAIKGKFGNQLDQKANLAFAPLAKASAVVDLQAKEKEEDEEMTIIQGQALAANNNPHFDDPQDEGEVKIYTVKNGDTVSSIALKHDITVNTILWANDIENIDSIKPGDQIFILPVAGVTHIVKSGDTLDSIAFKYKADKDKIIAFNTLPANGKIEEGQQIVIPGGEKAIPAPSRPSGSNLLNSRQYASSAGGAPAVSGWKKLEGKAGSGHKFPYGYCTWYVAQRRFVPWAGNAGTWLYQAKVLGYKTGKSPQTGSILVTSESRWGHVAIVEKVSGGTITVSEMNYRGWGKVNKRVIALNSRVIKGFIY